VKENIIVILTSKKISDTHLSSKDKNLRLATQDLSLEPSNNCNNNELNSNPVSINIDKELYPTKQKRLFLFNNLIYKKRKRYLE
jgi:hypothetical protein